MQAALCLDSEIPFLTLLKRGEIAKEMIDERINAGKIAASFTESMSVHDKSKLFCNTKIKICLFTMHGACVLTT